jgi:hypothetical protein
MSRTVTLCLVAGALGLLGPVPNVLANGNYSHVWVAGDALGHLPDGDLRTALQDPHLANIVRCGAMYPDGGYAMNDGYGEISHWEPFHLAYLEWILAHYQPPYATEAMEHIAFLMGMVAHGLTDQMYDGMYLSRGAIYDDDGCADMPYGTDGSTDSCFAATQGFLQKPTAWVPADVLAPLYETQGHHVTAQTIKQGFNLVYFAIVHANNEGADPDVIAEYMAECPWSCSHQDDPGAPGSPVTCGPAIAAYWQVLWGLLNGHQGFDQPLLDTFFVNGSPWQYPTDASDPSSWVSFLLPLGVQASTVTPATVVVTGDDGQVLPTTVEVYYGTSSHLVNLKPQADWPTDTTFTVTASPPIATWNGLTLAAPLSFQFFTLPDPNPPQPDTAEVVEAEAVEAVAEVVEAEVVDASDASEGTPELAPDTAEAVAPVPDTSDAVWPEADTSEALPLDDVAPGADVPSTDDAPAHDAATGDASTGGGGSGGCTAGRPGDAEVPSLALVLLLAAVLRLARHSSTRRRALAP